MIGKTVGGPVGSSAAPLLRRTPRPTEVRYLGTCSRHRKDAGEADRSTDLVLRPTRSCREGRVVIERRSPTASCPLSDPDRALSRRSTHLAVDSITAAAPVALRRQPNPSRPLCSAVVPSDRDHHHPRHDLNSGRRDRRFDARRHQTLGTCTRQPGRVAINSRWQVDLGTRPKLPYVTQCLPLSLSSP